MRNTMTTSHKKEKDVEKENRKQFFKRKKQKTKKKQTGKETPQKTTLYCFITNQTFQPSHQTIKRNNKGNNK